jgi:hypothetical protein
MGRLVDTIKIYALIALNLCTWFGPSSPCMRRPSYSRPRAAGDIMAILENRTPPPPKPEKASRKEKRARQSAPVSEQEVEPGMDLPPNLIEPPHYFMMRTLNTKAHDLVAANRQTVSQAGERYATVGPSPCATAFSPLLMDALILSLARDSDPSNDGLRLSSHTSPHPTFLSFFSPCASRRASGCGRCCWVAT